MLLLGMLADIPEKSGLACTRFSRQENGLASVLNEVQSILKLLVLGVGYKRQVIGNLVIDISNYSKSQSVLVHRLCRCRQHLL